MATTEIRDGRRARGDATRRKAARTAAMIATVNGLDSITVGGLAAETGLSKSGILTVFGTRQAIQVAAVAEARRIYIDTVITPVWNTEPGRPRLRALLDSWLAYIRAETFPGGCFVCTASNEYGRRDGPVADSVRRMEREWLDLLESELRTAGARDPVDDAFRINALLAEGNNRAQLFGDATELERGHRLALEVVG